MINIEHTFIINLDYGNRAEERIFVGDVLDTFDKDTLCGANIFVNNNPYQFELLLSLNFEKDGDIFEKWLKEKYPLKSRQYRLHFEDMRNAAMQKGYSICGLLNSDMLTFLMPSTANGIFLNPDRTVLSSIWKPATPGNNYSVFLSHSSNDKKLVDIVFNELHKADIRSWFDRYQIEPGDSITDKINEGLACSNLGLLFLSKSFLNIKSGWPIAEANYFFQQLMKNKNKELLVLNIDLSVNELPPLLQDMKFIDMQSQDAVQQVVSHVKKKFMKK